MRREANVWKIPFAEWRKKEEEKRNQKKKKEKATIKRIHRGEKRKEGRRNEKREEI